MQDISQAYAKHYVSWKQHLQHYAEKIEELLESRHIHGSVKIRVKALESLSEKQSYLSKQTSEPDPEIKDLLGLRVVVPFQEGVEKVVECLKQHYSVEEIERKSEKLSFREFAYDAVHIEIPLQEDLGLPRCCKPVIEIQVRTILQDAWAEVEHELIYKNHFRFPNNESIRKKLAALNASLTLSDMIFQEIRDSQKEMEKWGHERFQALIDKAAEFSGPTQPPSSSLEDYKNDTALHPENQASIAELERNLMAGLKAHNAEDYKTAIYYYTLVLEGNPGLPIRSVVFSHRGMAHFMLQQESRALSDFDRSFYCDKSNYRSLNYRAMVLRRMGYVEQALECFVSSLEINPAQAEVYYLRAQTLIEIDQHDQAHNDLIRALELEPDNAEARSLLDSLNMQAEIAAKDSKSSS